MSVSFYPELHLLPYCIPCKSCYTTATMSSRMRVTKGHSGNRRSHHALTAPRLSQCANCNEYHLRHNVCKACGFYKGKQIIANKTKAETAEVVEA